MDNDWIDNDWIDGKTETDKRVYAQTQTDKRKKRTDRKKKQYMSDFQPLVGCIHEGNEAYIRDPEEGEEGERNKANASMSRAVVKT